MTLRKKWAFGTAAGGLIGIFVGAWTFFSGNPEVLITAKSIFMTIAALLSVLGITLAWPGDPPE